MCRFIIITIIGESLCTNSLQQCRSSIVEARSSSFLSRSQWGWGMWFSDPLIWFPSDKVGDQLVLCTETVANEGLVGLSHYPIENNNVFEPHIPRPCNAIDVTLTVDVLLYLLARSNVSMRVPRWYPGDATGAGEGVTPEHHPRPYDERRGTRWPQSRHQGSPSLKYRQSLVQSSWHAGV